MQFIGVLVQDLDEGLADLLLLEVMVLVGVELGKHLVHPLSDELGEAVIGEGELTDPSGAEWP